MGHSTIAATVDPYGRLLRDANRQAADTVSILLTSAARGLLVEHGALEGRDDYLARFDRWAATALRRVEDP